MSYGREGSDHKRKGEPELDTLNTYALHIKTNTEELDRLLDALHIKEASYNSASLTRKYYGDIRDKINQQISVRSYTQSPPIASFAHSTATVTQDSRTVAEARDESAPDLEKAEADLFRADELWQTAVLAWRYAECALRKEHLRDIRTERKALEERLKSLEGSRSIEEKVALKEVLAMNSGKRSTVRKELDRLVHP